MTVPIMMIMMSAMGIWLAVGTSSESTPVNERNLFGQINTPRITSMHSRMMTPAYLTDCQGAQECGWQWNLWVRDAGSIKCNDTGRLDHIIINTSDHDSHIIMDNRPEPACSCDGTMGCVLEASQNRFQVFESRTVGRTQQNPLRSADIWTVTDKVVFGLVKYAQFRGMWKFTANRQSRDSLDGQYGKVAVWCALMNSFKKCAK